MFFEGHQALLVEAYDILTIGDRQGWLGYISKSAVLTLPDAGSLHMSEFVLIEDYFINNIHDAPSNKRLELSEFDTLLFS